LRKKDCCTYSLLLVTSKGLLYLFIVTCYEQRIVVLIHLADSLDLFGCIPLRNISQPLEWRCVTSLSQRLSANMCSAWRQQLQVRATWETSVGLQSDEGQTRLFTRSFTFPLLWSRVYRWRAYGSSTALRSCLRRVYTDCSVQMCAEQWQVWTGVRTVAGNSRFPRFAHLSFR
jgi:hypothetical protein